MNRKTNWTRIAWIWFVIGGLAFSAFNTVSCWKNEADKTIQVEVWMPPAAEEVSFQRLREIHDTKKYLEPLRWEVYQEAFGQTPGQVVAQTQDLYFRYEVHQGSVVFSSEKNYQPAGQGAIAKISSTGPREGKVVYEVELRRRSLLYYAVSSIILFVVGFLLTVVASIVVWIVSLAVWDGPIGRWFVFLKSHTSWPQKKPVH